MYELIQAGKRTFYMEGYARAGIYVFGKDSACAIDTGADEHAGLALLKHLKSMNLRLELIINTHSHADHTGGNALLKKETGCAVYAPGAESAFISEQIISPAFMYGGNPMPELWPGFVSESCKAERLRDSVLPEGLSVVSLDGHSFSHVGILTSDNVCFIGDALTAAAVIKKGALPTLYDVGRTLESFDTLDSMKGVKFIPAHEPMPNDFTETIALNRQKTLDMLDLIRDICGTPVSFETLTRNILDRTNQTANMVIYMLTQNTLKSYLTYLHGRNEVEYFFENNTIMWRVKK